ncbi:hypothetical protein WJX73_009308, partial [Symbiochloris irregularis]
MEPLRQALQHPSHTDDPPHSTTAASPAGTQPAVGSGHGAPAQMHPAGQILASPAVRKLARDVGVALASVPGTGPSGRVTKEDVQACSTHQAAATADTPSSSESPAPAPASLSPEHRPLRGYRRAMVAAMTAAAAVPHCHFFDDIGVDELMRMREALQGSSQLAGQRLTLLPLLIKALSLVLLDHEELNSSLGEDGASIIVHRRHNIGVAMATPSGLVVSKH